ncbi:unnamed protein product [Clavelina lepadiformis]|uniref:Uncharacterized protein n=1 Tax=Clavelina lepadiformis TaxID=159417 RepID=A0ABP0GIL9_CLALP
MECDPGIIQVDVLLKAISDLISQELKSLRQEMKMEFAQLQVNIEDMVLKILAETKKTETMNNAIPIEEISQPLHVESDISLKIEDVYSEKAPDFPLVEAIKEEPLLFEEYEVSQPEIDDLNISMLDKIPSQSNIGVNATFKIVKPQSCVARNSDEKFSDSVKMFLNKSTAIERIKACKVDTQTMESHPVGMQGSVLLKAISDMVSQEFKSMRQDMRKEFVQMQESMEDVISTLLAEIKKTETMNNAIPVEETSQTTVVKSNISLNIEEVYSEKAPVFPLVEAIKEEPLLLEKYEDSQTEIDDPNISMLNKFPPQSDIGVNATVKIVKPQSCVARNSDEECSDSVEMFLDKSTAIEDNVQVGVLLKTISNMISQDFKSMRLDMEMEETKETETMNNAMSHRRNITTISVRSQVCVFPRLPLRL